MKKIVMCVLFALVIQGAPVLAIADTVPVAPHVASGYRNDGSGVWPDATPAILDGTKPKILWTAPLPSGGDSAPLLVGDLVVVTTEPDQILAFDAATGKERWKTNCDVFSTFGEAGAALKEAFYAAHAITSLPTVSAKANEMQTGQEFNPAFNKDSVVVATKAKMSAAHANIYIPLPIERPADAAPSPCTDGKYIVVKFRSGMVGCYDLNGKEIWKQRLAAEGKNGASYSSPSFMGGILIVPFPGGKNSKGHLALDPATGKTLWQNPEIGQGSWGTVLSFPLGDRQLGVSGAGQIFEPTTGKLLAQITGFGQHTTIARWKDILVVPSGQVYSLLKEKTRAFRLVSNADGTVTATQLWEVPETGGNCPPSVCLDGLFLLSAGKLHGYQIDDNKEVAEPKPILSKDPMGAHRVLPGLSVAGDTCVRLGLTGNIALIRVEGGVLKTIGNVDLPKDNYNGPPAFAGKRMYVHGHTQLLCLGE